MTNAPVARVGVARPASLGNLLGSGVYQIAYAVPDLVQAQRHFHKELGVERFMVLEDFTLQDTLHAGKPAQFHMDVALAHAGEVCIELMQLRSETGPIPHPSELNGPRFHHLGIMVPNWDDAKACLDRAGLALAWEGHQGEAVRCGFVDLPATLGHMIELIYVNEEGQAGLDLIKYAQY